jgi:hypothetical protein
MAFENLRRYSAITPAKDRGVTTRSDVSAMTGEEATERGYRRTSNTHLTVSRVDTPQWPERMGLRPGTTDFSRASPDLYRRVYSKDHVVLAAAEFRKVPTSSGDTTGFVAVRDDTPTSEGMRPSQTEADLAALTGAESSSAGGIDFAKLRDPVWRWDTRLEIALDDAANFSLELRDREALAYIGDEEQRELRGTERRFIRSARHQVYQGLTDPQRSWLQDIARGLGFDAATADIGRVVHREPDAALIARVRSGEVSAQQQREVLRMWAFRETSDSSRSRVHVVVFESPSLGTPMHLALSGALTAALGQLVTCNRPQVPLRRAGADGPTVYVDGFDLLGRLNELLPLAEREVVVERGDAGSDADGNADVGDNDDNGSVTDTDSGPRG